MQRPRAALLVIDVQNYGAYPAGGSFARPGETEKDNPPRRMAQGWNLLGVCRASWWGTHPDP
jgi:nicotinamidase-related amidase